MTRLAAPIALGTLLLLATPLAARESLGVYDSWAAFRDAKPARCYAIAKAQGSQPAPAYATVSNWPEKKANGRPRSATVVVRKADGGVIETLDFGDGTRARLREGAIHLQQDGETLVLRQLGNGDLLGMDTRTGYQRYQPVPGTAQCMPQREGRGSP